MDYTRRTLTKLSDRPMALAGLANYQQAQTLDTYLSGLWFEDLAFQLLWYVDRASRNGPVRERVQRSVAPSWSWLSVPGPISYIERYPVGRVLSHKRFRTGDAVEPLLRWNGQNPPTMAFSVPLDPDNPFGLILFSTISIGAHVLPVQFDLTTNEWHPTRPIYDFVPGLLRVFIDVENDSPNLNPTAEYVFLLVGSWVGLGMMLECAQAVCIIARRLPPEAEPILETAEKTRWGVVADEDVKTKPVVEITRENSYERIGLVRGAGSIEAWKNANLPEGGVYLF